MKILGSSGIFPVMFRRTHRRAFISLSQTYQRELTSEKGKRFNAERQLERERLEWQKTLNELTGYSDSDGVHHQLSYEEKPGNMGWVKVQGHWQRDATSFAFAVTNFLLNQVREQGDTGRRYLARLMTNEIHRLIWEEITREHESKVL